MVSGVLTVVGEEPLLVLVQFDIRGVSFLSGDDSHGLVAYLSRDPESPFFGTLFDDDLDLTCHPPVMVRGTSDHKATLTAIKDALTGENPFVLCDLSPLPKEDAYSLSEKIDDRFPRSKILIFAPACFDSFPGIKVDALRPLPPDPEPEPSPEAKAAESFERDFGGIGPMLDEKIVPSTARRFEESESEPLPKQHVAKIVDKQEPLRIDVLFVAVFFLLASSLNLIAHFLYDPNQPIFAIFSFGIALVFQFCASIPVGFAIYDERSYRSRNVLISYAVHTLCGSLSLALSASLLGLSVNGWAPVAFCVMFACFPLTGLITALIAKRLSNREQGRKKGKK